MPFNELQRRDSWPPTIMRLHLGSSSPEVSSDHDLDINMIDENPFEYFLTSPDEIDDMDMEDLSAGIDSGPQVREVSPSSLQRIPLIDDDDDDEEPVTFGMAIPMSLRDFTMAHGKRDRSNLRATLPGHSAGRGRAAVRLTPRGRGHQRTRSLSAARRPHAWREPSPELHAIHEERESDESEEGRMEIKRAHNAQAQANMAAQAETEIEKMEKVVEKKSKKRVHWAL